MAIPDDPKTNQQVFYLDEDKSDFTFYLEVRSNTEVIERFLPESSGDQFEKTRSAAVEIEYTSQALSSGRVVSIADTFWERDTPQKEYLLEEMSKSHADSGMIEKLRAKTGSDDDKEKFIELFNKLLGQSVFDDFSAQPWAKNKRLPDSYAAKQTGPVYKRLLFAACFPEFTWKIDRGRALLCFSSVGKYLSVTVRKKKRKGYKPDSHDSPDKRKEFLFSTGEYCDALYKQIFGCPTQAPARGLLVVTGATSSLKSEIARGLIYKYLNVIQAGQDRPPHLVTFEDPIESFLYHKGESGLPFVSVPFPATGLRVDYTPRELDSDVGGLRDALNDALRQTPAVFFVGETRNKREWGELLDFAATGHLIVTTAHAGSLVEAIHKIFEARSVKTAGDRAEIASKLLGVIHLRGTRAVCDKTNPKGTSVLIPALWRSTPAGVAALTSNGLASVLPERPTGGNESGTSCLGRKWFIDDLLTTAREDINHVFGSHFDGQSGDDDRNRDVMSVQLTETARRWDLEGV